MNAYERRVILCAVCSALRGEVDGWFVISVLHGRFLCAALAPAPSLRKFDAPVCGHQCAAVLLERFLNSGSIEKRKNES
jgi:hypothetical protein